MLKCLRCGHEWHNRTDTAPKKCPKCQAMNWNTARPETAKCAKCSHEWQPRTGITTKHCPGCKTKKWNGAPAPTPSPSPETQTQLDRFNSIDLPDEPHTAKCPKCFHEWQSRTDAPKKCPKCQARLDADVGVKAEKRAKYCAARALAAVGPLAEEDPNAARYSWDVYDWTGAGIGYTPSHLIIRTGLSDLDPEDHYPVISGGRDGADGRYIEPQLYGWIRRDAPFERRS